MSYKIKEDYLLLLEPWTIVPDPPEIMVVNSPLNTSSLQLPVTSRVNPLYLKRINMVELYTYNRGAIHSLTNNVNMVG